MIWEDYRKVLGIELDDNEKTKRCTNIILNELEAYFEWIRYDRQKKDKFDPDDFISYDEYLDFCNYVGIRRLNTNRIHEKTRIFEHLQDFKDDFQKFIFYYIALINALRPNSCVSKNTLINIIEKAFSDSEIKYEIIKNKDSYLLIPSGAKELDKALVSENLIWLKDYKSTMDLFKRTLAQYVNGENPRDVADNLRKLLECFLQEFFQNKKILSTNISEVGKFLKGKQVNKELINIFTNIMVNYDSANNAIAKHHDDVNDNMLEFLLYQTGVFIRALIKLK